MSMLRQIGLGMLSRLAAALPPRWGARVRNLWFRGRPVLDYLEFHLADHCNMNCAGCSHYSPCAEPRLASLESVRRDFARLREIFRSIRKVRLMGGEPLLHPDAVAFFAVVRAAFPKCRITLATNGLLLARQPASFWEACRREGVGVDVTLYPPMAAKEGAIRALCAEHGVPLRVTPNGAFLAKIDPAGRQPMRVAFRACRRGVFCPFLRDGRIYPCAESCLAAAYNRMAGTKIPAARGLALADHTGREILEYLMCPVFACAHCSPRHRVFAWHNAGIRPEDWQI